MNSIKRIAAVCLSAMFTFSLTACSLFGHSYKPTQTGIYIADDRTIQSAEITDFDNSAYSETRYNEDDLKTFVDEAISTYNTEHASEEVEEPVSIDTLDVSGDVATLILEYATAEDYLKFNGTSDAVPVKNLVVGSVADGVDSGIDFSNLVDIEGKSVDEATVTENSDYTLVMVKGNTEIQTEGKIQYYSSGLTKVDEYTMTASGEETYFIIFK